MNPNDKRFIIAVTAGIFILTIAALIFSSYQAAH